LALIKTLLLYKTKNNGPLLCDRLRLHCVVYELVTLTISLVGSSSIRLRALWLIRIIYLSYILWFNLSVSVKLVGMDSDAIYDSEVHALFCDGNK